MSHNRGSALLSALFIMVLVAISTTTLTLEIHQHIIEAELITSSGQLSRATDFARFWAMHALTHEPYKNFGKAPGMLPVRVKNISIAGMPDTQISMEIIDLNARFNLNNLNKPSMKPVFFQLANHVLKDKSEKTVFNITAAIARAVSDQEPNLLQHNTKIIAHTPMASLSELDLLAEVTPEVRNKLLPYVTVLPRNTPINLNTASEDIIMALLGDEKDTESLEALLALRADKRIKSMEEVTSLLKKMQIESSLVTLESQYFLSIGRLKMEQHEAIVYSLLKRVKNKQEEDVIYLLRETWNTN